MKGEIELYNISFLILKVELHFKSEIMPLYFYFNPLTPESFTTKTCVCRR